MNSGTLILRGSSGTRQRPPPRGETHWGVPATYPVSILPGKGDEASSLSGSKHVPSGIRRGFQGPVLRSCSEGLYEGRAHLKKLSGGAAAGGKMAAVWCRGRAGVVVWQPWGEGRCGGVPIRDGARCDEAKHRETRVPTAYRWTCSHTLTSAVLKFTNSFGFIGLWILCTGVLLLSFRTIR